MSSYTLNVFLSFVAEPKVILVACLFQQRRKVWLITQENLNILITVLKFVLLFLNEHVVLLVEKW